jgi:hypothetical protein
MTIKDFERFLRDSGFSKSEAVKIASQGFRERSDSGHDELQNNELINALDKLIQSIKEF